jgi:protein-S-isoprenylcysteine O-methyltransferase Ste14
MELGRTPALVLGVTVCVYWTCVLVMMIKVSRKNRKRGRVLVPQQRKERIMGLVWVPLVLAWMVLPLIAADRPVDETLWLAIPGWAASNAAAISIRFAAAALAIVWLGMSIVCWRKMGRQWRMAVDPTQESPLIVDGPFAIVRHPIYALSIALMTCSLIVVPTPPMLVIAVTHIALMLAKARNEEDHLRTRHGAAYDDYCRRTGRFVPRPGAWR